MSISNTLPQSGSHKITLATAIQLTSRYRTNRETILATAYKNQDILPLSETFSRADIDDLLAQSGCQGLRIYYGMTEDDKLHAVMVAVNDQNEDIIPDQENSLISEENIIIEEGQRCPVICPPTSPLND